MFTVETKISGTLINYTYCRNCEQIEGDLYRYYYEHYSPENGKLIKGDIKHNRSDGINKLIVKILKKVLTKEKGEK